jgi:hypothetical protein
MSRLFLSRNIEGGNGAPGPGPRSAVALYPDNLSKYGVVPDGSDRLVSVAASVSETPHRWRCS